ncbi:hypothetical protein D3C78_636890 [compost metagenome]
MQGQFAATGDGQDCGVQILTEDHEVPTSVTFNARGSAGHNVGVVDEFAGGSTIVLQVVGDDQLATYGEGIGSIALSDDDFQDRVGLGARAGNASREHVSDVDLTLVVTYANGSHGRVVAAHEDVVRSSTEVQERGGRRYHGQNFSQGLTFELSGVDRLGGGIQLAGQVDVAYGFIGVVLGGLQRSVGFGGGVGSSRCLGRIGFGSRIGGSGVSSSVDQDGGFSNGRSFSSVGFGLCTGRGFLGADLGHQGVDDFRIVVERRGDLVDGVQGFRSSTNQCVNLGLGDLVGQEGGDVLVGSASQGFGFGSNTVVLDVTQTHIFFGQAVDDSLQFAFGSEDSRGDSGSLFAFNGGQGLATQCQGIVGGAGGRGFASQDLSGDFSEGFTLELQGVGSVFVRQCGDKTLDGRLQSGFECSVGHCHLKHSS